MHKRRWVISRRTWTAPGKQEDCLFELMFDPGKLDASTLTKTAMQGQTRALYGAIVLRLITKGADDRIDGNGQLPQPPPVGDKEEEQER